MVLNDGERARNVKGEKGEANRCTPGSRNKVLRRSTQTWVRPAMGEVCLA
jgi:hypothetical protein